MTDIPIENVYYLLCYSWKQMREGEIVATGATDHTELVDLFAKVLINGTRKVLRQGLDRGYVTRSEDRSRLQGRIDFATSVRRALLPKAQAHCRYDTLSRDVLHNRILKSTIRSLIQTATLDDEHRADLRYLYQSFREVKDVPLRRSLFQRVQLHSNNSFYRFLLNVCELVECNLIVEEAGRGRHFRDFRREDAVMDQLFEKFLRNFYQLEQEVFDVSAPHIEWDVGTSDLESANRIPIMRTDIILESEAQVIIVDAKYSASALTARYDKGTYNSQHLYQLFAYLKNAERKAVGYRDAEGMLLYPTVDFELNDAFTVDGHRMRICTIDLAQEWSGIHDDLLALVKVN